MIVIKSESSLTLSLIPQGATPLNDRTTSTNIPIVFPGESQYFGNPAPLPDHDSSPLVTRTSPSPRRTHCKCSFDQFQGLGAAPQGLRLLAPRSSDSLLPSEQTASSVRLALGSITTKKLHLFVKPNGKYNISRIWCFQTKLSDIILRDKFHFLLNLRMNTLLPLMFCSYVLFAAFLSILLAIVTEVRLQYGNMKRPSMQTRRPL